MSRLELRETFKKKIQKRGMDVSTIYLVGSAVGQMMGVASSSLSL